MARPHKQTVDYFPHYSDASNGKTLYILENKFGNDGYAFWFKMLELLASSEGHIYDARNPVAWEFLLAKTHVGEDTARTIMNLLVELDAIDRELWSQKIIWIQNLVDNVAEAYRNRKTELPVKPSYNGQKPDAMCVSGVNNGVSSVRNPHMKLDEMKLDETKGEKATLPEVKEMEFNDYVEELRPQYSDLDFDNQLKKFSLYWSEGGRKLKRPKLALTNWMDKAREFKKEAAGGKHKGYNKRDGTKLPDRNSYTEPPYDSRLDPKSPDFIGADS